MKAIATSGAHSRDTVPALRGDTTPDQDHFNSVRIDKETSRDIIDVVHNGDLFNIVRSKGSLEALTINGRIVPAEKFSAYTKVISGIYTNYQRQLDDIRKTDSLSKVQARLYQQQQGLVQQQAGLDRLQDSLMSLQKHNVAVQNKIGLIMQDLVNEKIVPDAEALKTFSLNWNELVVNGQKQSTDIYSRFKEKYLSDPKDQFNLVK